VPIILAILEVEFKKITVCGHPRQKVPETPSQLIAWCGGMYLSSQARKEKEIRRIRVLGQPGDRR
jgi:hypothetical protein